MLESLKHLRAALEFVLRGDGQGAAKREDCDNLLAEQWDLVDDLLVLLKPFMKAQEWLEGDKYITASHVIPEVAKLRAHLEKLKREDTAIQNTAMVNPPP